MEYESQRFTPPPIDCHGSEPSVGSKLLSDTNRPTSFGIELTVRHDKGHGPWRQASPLMSDQEKQFCFTSTLGGT